MKRKLANIFQWLADRCDRVAADDRKRMCARASKLFDENFVLHDRIATLEVVVPDVTTEWTPENAVAFRDFLATATGSTLSNRLRSICAANAINGSRNTVNTVHAAGVSAGWDEAVRYLHSLSRVSRVPDTKEHDKAPPGETELLEQLSP